MNQPSQSCRRVWCGVLCAAGLLLAGCSSLSSHHLAYIGAPRSSATDATRVEILRGEPTRAHAKLGEVVVTASLDPSPTIDKIEGRLRQEAAKLGADAVVLVQDRAENVGAVATGPWWSYSISNVQGRVLVGIAIKYK